MGIQIANAWLISAGHVTRRVLEDNLRSTAPVPRSASRLRPDSLQPTYHRQIHDEWILKDTRPKETSRSFAKSIVKNRAHSHD
ncbi:hypothetical protein K227x_05080 [Rubripirellula lacrimiformis]|uniref:Uncharacterized protein n=1 Tax=Rubripirellula lacrimiformis TaxID=1930273 RepID=A0A517N4S0_9BACT|nr:hypothetical protein K227x_05080 [Rubripirellula lacrimiformis]